MAEDDYEAMIAEYEAKAAEFEAKVEKLVLAERALVAQDHEDEALRRHWVEKYDIALQASDEAGVAAYMAATTKLHNKYIERKAALASVRAEYDALARDRPRRPRRTWAQLLGFK